MVIAWGSSIIKTAEVLKKTIVSGPHRLLRSEYKSIKGVGLAADIWR